MWNLKRAHMNIARPLVAFSLVFTYLSVAFADPTADHQRSPNSAAIKEVNSGKRTVANAAWWGFDPADSTRFLQAAIDSGAKKVIVSNVGRDWIIAPITLASNQEIVFEPGVVVTAKPGEFHGLHDSLFKATDLANIRLTGYGATLRMQKSDYMTDKYEKAEWRSGIFLNGCSGVVVEGLTIRDTGGDGIYLGDWGKGYNDNITIKDVLFDDNYRQGISIISAEKVLVENCVLKNTRGTGPAAGIDLEPDNEGSRLTEIVVRNCIADNNDGPGFCVSPAKLSSKSHDISVLFENCLVSSGQSHGFMVSAVRDDGPQGYIEFRNCHAQNTRLHGARILDKSARSAVVRFVNCTWRNVAVGDPDSGEWDPQHPNRYEGVANYPIVIHLRGSSWSTQPGGIVFEDCTVFDDEDRPFLAYRAPFDNPPGLTAVSGTITVVNPHGATMELGPATKSITLRVNTAAR